MATLPFTPCIMANAIAQRVHTALAGMIPSTRTMTILKFYRVHPAPHLLKMMSMRMGLSGATDSGSTFWMSVTSCPSSAMRPLLGGRRAVKHRNLRHDWDITRISMNRTVQNEISRTSHLEQDRLGRALLVAWAVFLMQPMWGKAERGQAEGWCNIVKLRLSPPPSHPCSPP
jgi:hypothetical protein